MRTPVDRIDPISERRRYRRVRVNLVGRYMLATGDEHECRIRDISPGDLALMAPISGRVGERVIAYIDQIGRLEGVIVRNFPSGFAFRVQATEHGRDRIASRLARVADERILPEIIS